MDGHPVIWEYVEGSGALGGEEIHAPLLHSVGLLLTTQGADEILVPAPDENLRERVSQVREHLPRSLRRRVRLIDGDSSTLRRIDQFLEPISEQADEWPETAFASTARTFLYHLALGSNHNATAVDGDIVPLHEFLTCLSADSFEGEARYRVSQIAKLGTAYEPIQPTNVALQSHIGPRGSGPRFRDLLESAEFADVVDARGRLGYLTNPRIGLRRLKRAIRELVSREDFSDVIAASESIASVAAGEIPAQTIRAISEIIDQDAPFYPPFTSTWPQIYDAYRVALKSVDPSAEPKSDVAFQVRRARGDRATIGWVNEEEDDRLDRPPEEAYQYREAKLREAKESALSLFS